MGTDRDPGVLRRLDLRQGPIIRTLSLAAAGKPQLTGSWG
jgi:hypothetical protein